MYRRLLMALWLAAPLFLVTTGAGCGNDEPVTPKVQGTVPDNLPKPLPPPNAGGQPAKGQAAGSAQ